MPEYKIRFSQIDAKDYPPLIVVKDGSSEWSYQQGATPQEFVAHKVATTVYMEGILRARQDAENIFNAIMSTGTIDAILDESYQLDDGLYDLGYGYSDKYDDLWYS